jgi:hypothetical protein
MEAFLNSGLFWGSLAAGCAAIIGICTVLIDNKINRQKPTSEKED